MSRENERSAVASRTTDDPRVVLTLDAGGTNFVFSAMQGQREVVQPVSLPSCGSDLQKCLANLVEGFTQVSGQVGDRPAAISFAFPGPADYPAGIIGDLPNLPAFRGGVALGPMLSERFAVPVFINNDGDLFALGEAIAGLLPQVNALLAERNSPKRFNNLFGVTLGTGFGGGIVTDGDLHLGDNSAGAEVWLVRNKLHPQANAEASVGVRAVRRTYSQLAAMALDASPEPKDLFEIAGGALPGNQQAARETFRQLGEVAGDAIASATTLVDGLVVVGGGLAGAHSILLPAIVEAMNSPFTALDGEPVARMESTAFNLDDPAELELFVKGRPTRISVPGSQTQIDYDPLKRIGVGVSRLGTSRAIATGAYAFALKALNRLA